MTQAERTTLEAVAQRLEDLYGNVTAWRAEIHETLRELRDGRRENSAAVADLNARFMECRAEHRGSDRAEGPARDFAWKVAFWALTTACGVLLAGHFIVR